MNTRKHIDAGSLVVMLLTLVFFVAALFFKGLSHALLLEAGVFLVSVKLIIMSYRNAIAAQNLDGQLNRILALLEQREAQPAPAVPLRHPNPTAVTEKG